MKYMVYTADYIYIYTYIYISYYTDQSMQRYLCQILLNNVTLSMSFHPKKI